MKFILIMNFKMSTMIVGILKFMTGVNVIVLCKKTASHDCSLILMTINSMLMCVEDEKEKNSESSCELSKKNSCIPSGRADLT